MRMGKGKGLSTRSRLRHSLGLTRPLPLLLPRNGIHATLRHSPSLHGSCDGMEGMDRLRIRREKQRGRAKNSHSILETVPNTPRGHVHMMSAQGGVPQKQMQ